MTNGNGGRAARGVAAGAALAVITLAAPVPLGPGQPGPAGAAVTVGPLAAVHCGPLAGDPPLEAPAYAQQDGAGGGEDGWWCQLPHATKMPSNFTAFRRTVSPVTGTGAYADYGTEYVVKGTGQLSTSEVKGPMITVSSDVNSTVAPPAHLRYPPAPRGRAVSLGRGVKATVSKWKQIVTVSWRFPTSGVPKYLRGVAGVTVTGTDVPESTVLAVARTVQPG